MPLPLLFSGVSAKIGALAPVIAAEAVAGQGTFSSITSDMLMGVLNEVTSLVPVVIPATIGFIAFRKGWRFIKTSLRGA